MKKYFVLLTCMLTACITDSNAQLNQNDISVNAKTPSKGTNGNSLSNIYSTHLYSGTVDVSIPFYDYSANGLDLGVSLSYNTGGIKVDDIATNTGLGWALNTGAVITREVRGIPDEATYLELDSVVSGGSTNWAKKETRGFWITDYKVVDSVDQTLTNSQMDQEPDVFHVTLGAISFSFLIKRESAAYGSLMKVYMDTKKNITVDAFFSDENINSNFLYSDLARKLPSGIDGLDDDRILTFRITDQHGNQFFFINTEVELKNYIAQSDYLNEPEFTSDPVYRIPNTWSLKKIITYSGQVIQYDYNDISLFYPSRKIQNVQEIKGYSCTGGTMSGEIHVVNRELNTTLSCKRISGIKYPNGDYVHFIYDEANRLDIGTGAIHLDRALKRIEISKGYNGAIPNVYAYEFNYSYFNSEGSILEYPAPSVSYTDPTHKLRLKLDQIDLLGFDNTSREVYYQFNYNNDHYLPARLSGLTDCFGYYNGIGTGTVTGIPTSSYLYSQLAALNITQHSNSLNEDGSGVYSYGRNKTPNITYAQSNLLKSIQNGKGGKISFEYQNHNLSNPSDFSSSHTNNAYYDNFDVSMIHGTYQTPDDLEYTDANDGVCIKNIIAEDGFNPNNTVRTEYTFDFGYRFIVGGYSWYPGMLTGEITTAGPSVNAGITAVEKIYTNSFVGPTATIHGYNHGYSTVAVKQYGFLNELTDWKEYKYTNLIPVTAEEKKDGIGATKSRIQMSYGIDKHTFPLIHFESEYMGLLKSINAYSPSGQLLSKKMNWYASTTNPVLSFPSSVQTFFYKKSCTNGGSAAIAAAVHYFENGAVLLTTEENITYSSAVPGAPSMNLRKDFTYDDNNDLTETDWYDSKALVMAEKNEYATLTYNQKYQQYALGYTPDEEEPNHIDSLKYLIKKRVYRDGYLVKYVGLGLAHSDSDYYYNSSGENVIASISTYWQGIKVSGPLGNIRFPEVFTLKTDAPVASGTPWYLAKHFRVYDDHDHVLETGYNDNTTFSSAIWDTRIGAKIAEVSNAHYADIAYTSFEGDFTGYNTADYNKGNWNFDPAGVSLYTSADCMTGKYRYEFSSLTSPIKTFRVPGADKKYFVSFWYQGTRPDVYLGTSTAIVVTDQQGNNGWTLATCQFTGNGSDYLNIQFSGAGMLDELRMHPADALMTTETYEPLIGVSSHCNERNYITYYEYDAMGRLHLTRNIDRNIINMQKHVTQGSDN